MPLGQEDFQRVVSGKVIQGGPSPFYKRYQGGLPRVVTFAGEEVRWIGRVTTDQSVFGGSRYETYRTFLGVSPYRVVFFTKTGGDDLLSQSVWFDVDFEGLIYSARKGRKRLEYARLVVSRPELTGTVSKSITFRHRAVDTSGKEHQVAAYPMAGIKWYDPATGKFVRGKAQAVYEQLLEAYHGRAAVPVTALWYLAYKPEEASRILLSGGSGQDGPVPPAPAPGLRTEVVQPASGPVTCRGCGAALRAGAVVCGRCGLRVQEGGTKAVMVCPGCGLAVEESWRACPACSRKLVYECGGCGQLVRSHWKVCPFCQTGLSPGDTEEPESTEPPLQLCPVCSEPVQADWRVCPACRTRLHLTCPACDQPVEHTWRVCPFCEAELPSEGGDG